MPTEKPAGVAGQWTGLAKWGVIGAVAIVFMFLFQDEIKKLLSNTEEVSITTEGVKLKVKTVSTPLGETVLSDKAAPIASVPPATAVAPGSVSAPSQPTLTHFTDPTYGYSLAWPANGSWIKDDALASQFGMALFIRFHQSFENFTPNVNVTIEQPGDVPIGQFMRLAVPLLTRMGWQVVDVKMDEAANVGVRVLRNPNIPGGLFQIQRVILKNGLAYVATASKIETDSGAFPEMYQHMGEILNSFSAP